LSIADDNGNGQRKLVDITGNKIIAFVSEDRPVSMVDTIRKIRHLSDQKNETQVIVASLQKLSVKHLAMKRMVSSGNMLFINDPRWSKDHQMKKIKMPFSHKIAN